MSIGDFFARLGGRGAPPAGEGAGVTEDDGSSRPRVPTQDDLLAALDHADALVADGTAPGAVAARVQRVTATVRDTIPRLEHLGAERGYSVMATATDYLPEAVTGYLRLPRRFADTRPVERGRTSLMLLVDQLDLLGATMDRVFDAVCRDDANALVAHGVFLEQKFGHAAGGGSLDVGASLPIAPEPDTTAEPVADIGSPSSTPDAGSELVEPLRPPQGW